jgi:1-acyl-sn-glycerol-3-phosphate acyltransferase
LSVPWAHETGFQADLLNHLHEPTRPSLDRFQLANRWGREGATLVAYKTAELTLRALCDYHSHGVVGAEHIPKSGPALIVCNHSLATYDSFLMGIVVIDEVGRTLWAIADHHILSMPGVGAMFRGAGFVEGSREGAVGILQRGELLGVVPGGMREGLRSSRDRYRVDWRGRTGFVWVSMLSGAPIILAACPRADDIYDVRDSRVTGWVYERFRLPLPIFRGLGPTLIPRPVKLTHILSEPIHPPAPKEEVTEGRVREHHAYLEERMNKLMKDGLSAG